LDEFDRKREDGVGSKKEEANPLRVANRLQLIYLPYKGNKKAKERNRFLMAAGYCKIMGTRERR
jgi:hypothetical protein